MLVSLGILRDTTIAIHTVYITETSNKQVANKRL
jgi:hypothetical protein